MPQTNIASFSDNFPCRNRPLLIVADVSVGGMPIREMNAMLGAFFSRVQEVLEYTTESVFVNILTFSDSCRWISPTLLPLENFCFEPLTIGNESASLGGAFLELSKQMSRYTLFHTLSSPLYAPCIFLLSNAKTDDSFKKGIAALRENNWYKYAKKYQISTSQPGNDDLAKDFFRFDRKIVLPNGMEVPDLLRLFKLSTMEESGGVVTSHAKQQLLEHLDDTDTDNEWGDW